MLTARPATTGRPDRDRLLTLVRAPRIIIDFFAPFDRPIVLSSLGGMGLFLGIGAAGEFTGPVQVIGYSLAVFSLPAAAKLLVGELRDRALDRRAQQMITAAPPLIGGESDDHRSSSAA